MPIVGLAGLEPGTYRNHPLHGVDRTWTESNCYLDLWIELLHALGAEPLPLAACALSADFESTQWTFLKPSAEDLWSLFGLKVAEMNVWRAVDDHVIEELALGNLLTVEVDAWWLPDTAGTSYRTEHTKTSIVPHIVDSSARHLRYFHGPGYFSLNGDDYDGLFAARTLPPYIELVRLDHLVADPLDLMDRSRSTLRQHLAKRPCTNPILRMGEALEQAIPWLQVSGPAAYHGLAFGTCRQCGAGSQLAAAYAAWLGHHDGGLDEAAMRFEDVARDAKTLEFQLARAARGRAVDLSATVHAMARSWDQALDVLGARYVPQPKPRRSTTGQPPLV